ncbi:MAG: rhodanese-like domain-containing protein [Pyrinomonadaceae bacterium]|nr:rhodanese-like domain-containing protein [Pyrinomonadaceae bacterium]
MRSFISLSAAIVFVTTLLAGCSTGEQENRSANATATPTRVAATTPTPAPTTTATPNDGVRRITPAELQAALEKGEAVVVDVRSSAAFQKGHIKGARLIPAEQIASRAGELPRDKTIVTYCA